MKPLSPVLGRLLDRCIVVRPRLVPQLHTRHVLDLVEVLKLVQRLDLLLLPVALSPLLRHGINSPGLFLARPAFVVLDRNLVLVVRRLVLCRHVQNAVRVNVKRDVDLWNITWGWRDEESSNFPSGAQCSVIDASPS